MGLPWWLVLHWLQTLSPRILARYHPFEQRDHCGPVWWTTRRDVPVQPGLPGAIPFPELPGAPCSRNCRKAISFPELLPPGTHSVSEAASP